MYTGKQNPPLRDSHADGFHLRFYQKGRGTAVCCWLILFHGSPVIWCSQSFRMVYGLQTPAPLAVTAQEPGNPYLKALFTAPA